METGQWTRDMGTGQDMGHESGALKLGYVEQLLINVCT